MRILRFINFTILSWVLCCVVYSMTTQALALQETVVVSGSTSSLPKLSVEPLFSGDGVKITGQIMRLPSSDGGASSSSGYQVAVTDLQVIVPSTPGGNSQYLPAANVKVSYWMRDITNTKREMLSDNNGKYDVNLSNGVWMGAVCAREGSGVDYQPRFWQLRIQNNTVAELKAVDSPAVIVSISPVQANAGDTVTVRGSGFACSGTLQLRDFAPISIFGLWGDINYSTTEVRIEEFIFRDDQQLVFVMPDLQASLPSEQQDSLASIVSHIKYQSGGQSSNSVRMTQYVAALTSTAAGAAVMTSYQEELVIKVNKKMAKKNAKGGVL